MNSQRFSQLASQSQAGDKTALEQLLLQAYTPVSYQCRKLLKNDQAAQNMTKEILQRIPSQLNTLKDPALFEKWLGNLTAKHCMRAWNQQAEEQTTPPKKLNVPSDSLNQREMAMVVDQIVDNLPDGPRICITLYCCCKIPASGISKITGFSDSDVKTNLSQAQARIKGRLKKLAQQGVEFPSVTSIPELLQIAMYTPRNPEAASAMVGGILGKQAAAAPVPKRKQTAPGLKIAVAVVSILLVLMMVLIFFLERNRQAALETEATTITTESTTLPTQTTVSTTAAETTVETTVETTAETTVETTVETTEETTEATTESTTEPAPQAQQDQANQAASGGGNAASGTGVTAVGSNTSTASSSHTHSYQDAGPIGTTPAGCESAGWRTKICFVCGDTVKYQDPATLPAVGHNYSSTVKEPTTGREGYTIHTCTRCGDTYMDNYVPKLPAETQAPAASEN